MRHRQAASTARRVETTKPDWDWNGQWIEIGIRHSAFGIRHSAFGIRHSAFGIRHSAFGNNSVLAGIITCHASDSEIRCEETISFA
ncbi:hypothetical protein [Nitrosomonas sp.]|uniref:hypothetical protein n=1 Tax=Nitrosomonas sp. TaxID=42353 RepID=UPI00261A16E3|nr:hypothetical protein [Nitrosomonas sp.]